VLVPPEEVWGPIQAIRAQYDRQIRRWMPHITLIYPFRPLEDFPVVSAEFACVLRDMAPFQVTLREFREFQHRGKSFTLWLAPEPVERLQELQRALTRAVPDCDDVRRHREGFTPHLSVGQVRGSADVERVKNLLQADWDPLTFEVERVHLIWRNSPPDDIFRTDRTVSLGGQPG
jgi:2'-5' RNA ligase